MTRFFQFRSAHFIVFALIFCTVLSLGLRPTATHAASLSFTVNTTNDTIDDDIGDGLCADASGNCSLRAAVQEAGTVPGNDTITLSATTYTLSRANADGDEDFATTGDLDILDTNGTITINGAGVSSTIIDANDIDRVFEVATNAALTLTNLKVTGGLLGAASGAGISNSGALTLSRVNVTENYTSGDPIHITLYYGIGMYCASGSVTVSDSTISENRFADGVNGINGGGLYTTDSCETVTVNRTTFSNNEGYEGGGVHVNASTETTITLTDVTWIGNDSARSGAGLHIDGEEGDNPVVVNRAYFTLNEAESSGGGIFTDGPLQVTNATFYDNTANMESGVGGGFYANPLDESVIDITFSTFTQNSATSGGGIYFDGENENVRLRGVVLAYNIGTNPDCYGNLVSNDYNYIADITDCTVPPQSHDQLSVSPPAYMNTLTASDHGGEVDTLAFTGSEVKDRVPSAACLNAAGAALTTDARGVARPENTSCDLGAYELDQTNPVVTVTAGTDTIECAVDSWTNAGATVADSSPSLTASSAGSVTTTTVGAYTITYSATDYDDRTGTNTRTVTVRDTLKPTITLTGLSSVSLTEGETYTDEGATATDTCTGSLTSSIQATSTVDTTTPGTYSVTYNVSDPSNNAADAVTRTVTVQESAETDPVTVHSAIKDGGNLIVTYSNDSMETITPFSGSKNFRFAINTTNTALVTTNGKFVKTYENGTVIDQQKIGDDTLDADYYRLKVESLYDNYDSVVIQLAQKKTGTVLVMRLTAAHNLTKLQRAKVTIQNRKDLTITFAPRKHEFTTTFGTGKKKQVNRWKVKQNGSLVRVNK